LPTRNAQSSTGAPVLPLVLSPPLEPPLPPVLSLPPELVGAAVSDPPVVVTAAVPLDSPLPVDSPPPGRGAGRVLVGRTGEQQRRDAHCGSLPLARIAERGASEPFCLPVATEHDLRRIMGELLTDTLAGATRRLRVEAKILELLAVSLDATERHQKTYRRSSPSPDERRRIFTARDRLATDPLDPPVMMELARAVGLAPRRLHDGFRDVFGVTVLGWLRDARLDLGRTLLLEGLPIKEVAHRLGYSHANNFTTAFQARFGEPPAIYRRTRARP